MLEFRLASFHCANYANVRLWFSDNTRAGYSKMERSYGSLFLLCMTCISHEKLGIFGFWVRFPNAPIAFAGEFNWTFSKVLNAHVQLTVLVQWQFALKHNSSSCMSMLRVQSMCTELRESFFVVVYSPLLAFISIHCVRWRNYHFILILKCPNFMIKYHWIFFALLCSALKCLVIFFTFKDTLAHIQRYLFPFTLQPLLFFVDFF